jgi:hypothetical protein
MKNARWYGSLTQYPEALHLQTLYPNAGDKGVKDELDPVLNPALVASLEVAEALRMLLAGTTLCGVLSINLWI